MRKRAFVVPWAFCSLTLCVLLMSKLHARKYIVLETSDTQILKLFKGRFPPVGYNPPYITSGVPFPSSNHPRAIGALPSRPRPYPVYPTAVVQPLGDVDNLDFMADLAIKSLQSPHDSFQVYIFINAIIILNSLILVRRLSFVD